MKLHKMLWKEKNSKLGGGGGGGGVRMPPDSATLSSDVQIERAMPPPPSLGPNPERNPVYLCGFLFPGLQGI